MSELVTLENQVVVVTGAGRGIGRAHAVELARRGAAVVVNDVARPHADEVVTEIEAAGGTAVASYDTCASPAGGEAIVELARERFGAVDALVHNAAVLRSAPFEELTPEQLDEVLAVHLKAAFYVGQPAYRLMRERGYGRIVLTSSSAGIFGGPGRSNYAAAKAGLYGLCRAVALEGKPHGILANCVLPKALTDITAQDPGFPEGGFAKLRAWPGLYERLLPRSVAVLVAFLVSPSCSVTGRMYTTTAGRYARVFFGVPRGWLAPDVERVSADDVAARLDEIEARDFDGLVPAGSEDENDVVEAMIGDLAAQRQAQPSAKR
jgi:NAD(P)-dependent dehydrogenase (short-subunit alcohol dehydrogenase family)